MKPPLFLAGSALILALLASSCESDGSVSARAQEKSATYAALKPWQKHYIDTGSISEGFTPDMVYIAMGKPDKIDPKELPAGKSELWTYNRFYQHANAAHGFEHANLARDSDYASPAGATATNSTGNSQTGAGRNGLARSGATGGVQGGSMEPEDLSSYTVKVLFKNGTVARISAHQNQ